MKDVRLEPRVSLVIPVYNGADYLEQAIESALAQTYRNIEILVINDGSADDGATERIARRYEPRIRYLSKPNGGVASALNLAIDQMSGDYLSWLSHDDLYVPEKIEIQMKVLLSIDPKKHGSTVLYGDYAVFSNVPENATAVRLKGVGSAEFRFWLTSENTLHGCTLLIPRSAFQRSGVFNEHLRTTQDFDLWFRMAEFCEFRHVPTILVNARSHSGQGSVRMAETALAECNDLMIGFTDRLNHEELTVNGHRSLAQAYTELAASFLRRGFRKAALHALSKALTYWREEPASAVTRHGLTIVRALLADYLLRPARAVIPPQLRLKLKALTVGGKTSKAARLRDNISLRDKFSAIYDGNIFGGRLSRSGEGSDLVQTEVVRKELPVILRELDARSLLDAPCGDWYWMQHVELPVERYIGVDIVPGLIAENERKFGGPGREFHCLNLTNDDLPKVDVIFSRDCLVHLSHEDARRIVRNFKRSGSTYLLTTTFTDRPRNNELIGKDSFWRPLNLQAPPFNFPPPLKIVNEHCTEDKGKYSDKSLGLWRLRDITV